MGVSPETNSLQTKFMLHSNNSLLSTISIKSVIILFSLLFFSCGTKKLNGIGAVTIETIKIENFRSVTVGNGWTAVLTKGDSTHLVVKANKNLHQALQYHIDDKHLFIESIKEIGKAKAKTIFIYYTEELEEITATRNAHVSGNFLDQKNIEIHALQNGQIELMLDVKNISVQASEKGTAKLMGEAKNMEAFVEEGASVLAKELETKNAKTTAKEDGYIGLSVTDKFTANASKGGLIEYYGDPKKVTIHKTAPGNVIKK